MIILIDNINKFNIACECIGIVIISNTYKK